MKQIKLVSIFILLSLVGSLSQAKRTTYLAPIYTNANIGGYDNKTDPAAPIYCQSNFDYEFSMAGRTIDPQNRRTSGAQFGMIITLRNMAETQQTVTVSFDDVNFHASYCTDRGWWCTDEYRRSYKAGYSFKATIPAFKTVVATFFYGCNGLVSDNDCFLHFQSLDAPGVTVIPAPVTSPMLLGHTFFGTLGFFNTKAIPPPDGLGTYYKMICYDLESTMNMKVEVAEDKGAMTGTITVNNVGGIFGGTSAHLNTSVNYRINGGRPF